VKRRAVVCALSCMSVAAGCYTPPDERGGVRDGGGRVDRPADLAALPPPPPPAPAGAPPVRRDAGGAPDVGAAGYPYGAPCNTADYVPTMILLPKCGMCHNTKSSNLTNLDVTTSMLRPRLAALSRTCRDKQLVFTEPMLGGYLIDKLTAAPGICGTRMPAVGPALKADEIECIKTWLKSTR
jgi:hypothetical protein